ncbi:hypothetical protein JZ751_018662, partial [Albula glossodonta]
LVTDALSLRAGVAGLLVMLLMAAAEASVGSSNSSSFCTETEECLLFEPVCKTEEYEVRREGHAHTHALTRKMK